MRLSMSAHTQTLARPTTRPRSAVSLRRWTEREAVFSWLMVTPPVLFLLALVGYPFIYGIWLSLENRPVAKPGVFIGLDNFIANFHDPVFWQVAQNTFVYTFAATALKMAGADRPAAVGERGEIRGRGYVCQGLCRQVHQGGDCRCGCTAQADLQAGLRWRRVRPWKNPPPPLAGGGRGEG